MSSTFKCKQAAWRMREGDRQYLKCTNCSRSVCTTCTVSTLELQSRQHVQHKSQKVNEDVWGYDPCTNTLKNGIFLKRFIFLFFKIFKTNLLFLSVHYQWSFLWVKPANMLALAVRNRSKRKDRRQLLWDTVVFRANVVKNIGDPEKEQALQPEGATRAVDTELLH